jgi:hypothetical protein
METVETYTPVINLRCFSNYPHAEMELDSSGEWVSYNDYRELSEYADKLKSAVEELYNCASFDWDTMPEASRRKFHELVLKTADRALSKH